MKKNIFSLLWAFIQLKSCLDYSRVEIDLVVRLGRRKAQRMKFGWLGRVGGCPPQILCNKADAVKSARPKGKKCRL
jgi:hypothetical protein